MESVTILKIVNKDKVYTSKNGKDYCNVNYYVKLSNNTLVAIRPCFSKGYIQLDSVADCVINGSK